MLRPLREEGHDRAEEDRPGGRPPRAGAVELIRAGVIDGYPLQVNLKIMCE